MGKRQMRQAVAYLRSNDGSAKKLAAQRDLINAWAARTEVHISGWHLDFASGNAETARHTGLCEAVAELKARRAELLVVARPHLLTRSLSQMIEVLGILRVVGAEVCSADGAELSWPFLEHIAQHSGLA